jgi:hypothetical protein
MSELIVKVLEFDNTNATNINKSDNTNATNTNKGGWGRGSFHGIYPYIGNPEIWRLLFFGPISNPSPFEIPNQLTPNFPAGIPTGRWGWERGRL